MSETIIDFNAFRPNRRVAGSVTRDRPSRTAGDGVLAGPLHLLEYPGRVHQHSARSQYQRLNYQAGGAFDPAYRLEHIKRSLLTPHCGKWDYAHINSRGSYAALNTPRAPIDIVPMVSPS